MPTCYSFHIILTWSYFSETSKDVSAEIHETIVKSKKMIVEDVIWKEEKGDLEVK